MYVPRFFRLLSMHLLNIFILAFAAGITAVPLVPNVQATPPGRFSIDVHPNTNYIFNGPAALRRALSKYGMNMSSAIEDDTNYGINSKMMSTSPTGVYAYSMWDDVLYVCLVEIGGQVVKLDFDTGSSDLWVILPMSYPAPSKTHITYNPNKSPTFKLMHGAWFNITYADRTWAAGMVGTDTVKVGNAVVQNQAVELPLSLSKGWASDITRDGMLGLSFRNIGHIKPHKQKTFFENLSESLYRKLFTAYLRHNKTGSYDFGFIDAGKHDGEIQYTNLMKDSPFWEFPATSYKINGKTFQGDPDATATADTGTTLLLVSRQIAEDYYAHVEGSKVVSDSYVFPYHASLPNIDLAVGDKFATIKGKLINNGPHGKDTPPMCIGGLQAKGSIGGTAYIYGDIFFRNVLAVFDQENERFGFAPQKGL